MWDLSPTFLAFFGLFKRQNHDEALGWDWVSHFEMTHAISRTYGCYLKWGTPSHHPFIRCVFHINHPFWVLPFMETPVWCDPQVSHREDVFGSSIGNDEPAPGGWFFAAFGETYCYPVDAGGFLPMLGHLRQQGIPGITRHALLSKANSIPVE